MVRQLILRWDRAAGLERPDFRLYYGYCEVCQAGRRAPCVSPCRRFSVRPPKVQSAPGPTHQLGLPQWDMKVISERWQVRGGF